MNAITSDDWERRECVLVDAAGRRIQFGERITTEGARSSTHVCTGGRAPQHPGSSGRVWTRPGNEYFPHVFGLRWVRLK